MEERESLSGSSEENQDQNQHQNCKTLTMEEKLAKWRMEKRANKHQMNRGIGNTQSKKQYEYSKRRSSLAGSNFGSKKENSGMFSNSPNFEFNPNLLDSKNIDFGRGHSRRHSLLARPKSKSKSELFATTKQRNSITKTKENKVDNIPASTQREKQPSPNQQSSEVKLTTTSTQTSVETCETSTCTDLKLDSDVPQEQEEHQPTPHSNFGASQTDPDETTTRMDHMVEEISCLRFANDVLMQQLSQLAKEKDEHFQHFKETELKLSQLKRERESSNTNSSEVEVLKNTLTAALEAAVLEIEKVRKQLKETEEQNKKLRRRLDQNLNNNNVNVNNDPDSLPERLEEQSHLDHTKLDTDTEYSSEFEARAHSV
eukprot:CAMPEP_0204834112 /NCGR_PEP_ID=MMETSP1346-20131115/18815_1 /ASSEMBLY_ACC=CAM_ASM_000771 /TAXON_ID=215587 /ORGANISM="Aplanochytrium stocchinoi, Strain GSBS06" /LENGTH=370 /DNA_ID=CAMNT_0051967163 /DNA_START=148 /DNA_END=1260 /DNA_ORIENTATION=+